MLTFLYIVWFAAPSVFFLLAAYAQLERWSGKAKKDEVISHLKQGTFVLACALVCVAIEQNFLEDFVLSFLDPLVPLGLAQIILFPLVLLLAGKALGGSKPIQLQSNRINKATRHRKR